MLTTFFQITAGTVAGVAGIVAGQPFDTVKVRLQTAATGFYTSPLDCVRKVVKYVGRTAGHTHTVCPMCM